MMAAAIRGFQAAFTRDLGMTPVDVLIMHADANNLALTGNSETIYAVAMATKPGPVVLDVPPRVLGFLNDQWMRPMGDRASWGPDHGEGGRYLLVPPDTRGTCRPSPSSRSSGWTVPTVARTARVHGTRR